MAGSYTCHVFMPAWLMLLDYVRIVVRLWDLLQGLIIPVCVQPKPSVRNRTLKMDIVGGFDSAESFGFQEVGNDIFQICDRIADLGQVAVILVAQHVGVSGAPVRAIFRVQPD